MDGSGFGTVQAQRDRNGRFIAGASGNPAGKRQEASAPAGDHLHFACNNSSNSSPGHTEIAEAAAVPTAPPEAAAAPATPERSPFPAVASACIPPAITRLAGRATAQPFPPPNLDVHAANSLLRATS